MANKDKQAFIKELTGRHRRRRPLLQPSWRAWLWFAAALLLSAACMHTAQVFRPGFAEQLVRHPLFLIEIASALLFCAWGGYVLMVSATPGGRVRRGAVTGLWLLGALFIAGFASSFTQLAPEATMVGKREECWHEVVIYGTACLVLFVVMIRRGWVRFSWKLGWLYGLVAGLIPAALMQLACMYVPEHALKFHYLPVLFLVPAGLLFMRLARR